MSDFMDKDETEINSISQLVDSENKSPRIPSPKTTRYQSPPASPQPVTALPLMKDNTATTTSESVSSLSDIPRSPNRPHHVPFSMTSSRPVPVPKSSLMAPSSGTSPSTSPPSASPSYPPPSSSSSLNNQIMPLPLKISGPSPSHSYNRASASSLPLVIKSPTGSLGAKPLAGKHFPSSGSESTKKSVTCVMTADGFQWRKYGQKNVKGNAFPRSYYKCTFPGCNVKKQVEKLNEEDESLSSVVYKGEHNHGSPLTTRVNVSDQISFRKSVISVSEDKDSSPQQPFTTYAISGPNNTPRLVIETTSSVDHLDDGFNWRKYGQKSVKGSAFPKSYYKCAEQTCQVKKQVIQLSET
eukprot:gene10843-12629_t